MSRRIFKKNRAGIKKCPWNYKIARGKLPSKSARETQNCPWQIRKICPWKIQNCPWQIAKICPWSKQLPVANQQIKKFHGQFGHIWGKFPWNVPFCPWQIPKKVPVKLNNCPWQIRKSKSFTGKKKFHGGKKKHCSYPRACEVKWWVLHFWSFKFFYFLICWRGCLG